MLIAVLAGVVAVAAAVRSTWSPCGQSMLSTITPLGEQGRGNRFGSTATWFVLGATLGGVTLGLAAGLLAALVGALGVVGSTALVVGGLMAIAAAVADAGLFGIRVPYHRRQVNELWLDDYRSWVYGGGFGFQIGVGFATYIMTSALVLLVGLAALTGNPLTALAIGVLFGFVRGLGVLPGARLTTPSKLVEFHRRFDARSAMSRQLVIVVELAVAVVAVVAVGGVIVGAGVAAAIGLLFVVARRSGTVTVEARQARLPVSRWLPETFAPPTRVELPTGHHLRPIRASDIDLDYPAVMGSRARLWAIFGEAWGWPPSTMTRAQDLDDLVRHADEMVALESFNYAIFDAGETALLGCVYVDPPAKVGADAEISWWVVDSEVDGALDTALAETVPDWIATAWPFTVPRFIGRDLTWTEYLALPDLANVEG